VRLEMRLLDRLLQVDIPSDIPMVLVDPVLFEQVFVNLLENACKYTPPQSPLEIGATSDAHAVVVDIRDHGPGLPVGSENKVFEKFYRCPTGGRSCGTAGAGLGLAICRGIAEAHGGSIWAENAATGGVTFHVSVPIGGEPPPVTDAEGVSL